MKRIKIFGLYSLLLCAAMMARAQSVTTIAGPNSGINDALIVDDEGNIYGSDFGQSTNGSSSVYKIDTNGEVTTFSTGYSSCNGLAFDHEGNLYVVDYTGNASTHQIYKLDENGEKTAYGPPVNGASGIIFDPLSDTLYVSQYNGNSNRISKLSPDGNLTLHSNHGFLNGPVGMAFDSSHVLYVANFNDGKIFRFGDHGATIELIADIPNQSFWGVGFLTYADGHLYATGIGTHRIYQVSLTGEVVEFAGVGTPGLVDGSAGEAKFNRPNGIAANGAQDKLYVSDLITYAVREIDLDATTSVDEEVFSIIESSHLAPNPAPQYTVLNYELRADNMIRVALCGRDGKLIKRLFAGEQGAGRHQIRIDTESLAVGLYYCKITGGRDVQMLPISVSR